MLWLRRFCKVVHDLQSYLSRKLGSPRVKRKLFLIIIAMIFYKLISIFLLHAGPPPSGAVSIQNFATAKSHTNQGFESLWNNSPIFALLRIFANQTCFEKFQSLVTTLIVLISAYYFRDQTLFFLNMLGLTSITELPGLDDGEYHVSNSRILSEDLSDLPELIPDDKEETEYLQAHAGCSQEGKFQELAFDKKFGVIPRAVRDIWNETPVEQENRNKLNGYRVLPPIRNQQQE